MAAGEAGPPSEEGGYVTDVKERSGRGAAASVKDETRESAVSTRPEAALPHLPHSEGPRVHGARGSVPVKLHSQTQVASRMGKA